MRGYSMAWWLGAAVSLVAGAGHAECQLPAPAVDAAQLQIPALPPQQTNFAPVLSRLCSGRGGAGASSARGALDAACDHLRGLNAPAPPRPEQSRESTGAK